MLNLKSSVLLLGIVYILTLPQSNECKLYREHACEGHHLSLSCYIGDVIKILDAGYGRRNATICYFFDEPQPHFRPCQSPIALDVIRTYCDGHRTCSLRAKNSNFQDPCPGQVKYAEALFTCVPKNKYKY